MDLDLLDRLLSLGAVDGRLDERCELRASSTVAQARSAQREMPYHALLAGSAVVEGPGLEPTMLHAGDVLMLPSGEAHTIVNRAGGVAPGRSRGEAPETVTLYEAGGAATILLCGRFLMTPAAWRLYRSLLPDYVIVRTNADMKRMASFGGNGEAGEAGEVGEVGEAPDQQDSTSSRLSRLLVLMKEETEHAQPGHAAVLRHLSAALFGMTLRAAMHGTQAPAGMLALAAHPRLCEVAVQIVRAPAQAWTIEEMAGIAHMSRSSLIRSFGAAAGMTPAEFVTRVRIAEASRLLKDTEQSVAAIGEAVGYASEAAFQRAFKRETDLTPAAWRAVPLPPTEPPRPPRFVSLGGTVEV